jgi:hypothetical protein
MFFHSNPLAISSNGLCKKFHLGRGGSNWRSVLGACGIIVNVVARLVIATPIIFAPCLKVRGRRDKPGDDDAGS